MKLNQDLGDLSPQGKVALLGALALCCVVPMLIIFGALSVTGALFGGGTALALGAVALVVWAVWMGRHHRSMSHPTSTSDRETPKDV
jgi:hypothetical protein